jgi:putative tributyrin esterase
MASGPQYWTFVSEELPLLMRDVFPLSAKREETFAAGLSMGGYGALRLALAKPDRFAAAASLSGALDVARACRTAGHPGSRIDGTEIASIFGPELRPDGTDADLWHLAKQVAKGSGPRPRLLLACGTEDGLLEENRRFRNHLDSLGYENDYSEGPGEHEWGYWDAQIQRVIDWLPLENLRTPR